MPPAAFRTSHSCEARSILCSVAVWTLSLDLDYRNSMSTLVPCINCFRDLQNSQQQHLLHAVRPRAVILEGMRASAPTLQGASTIPAPMVSPVARVMPMSMGMAPLSLHQPLQLWQPGLLCPQLECLFQAVRAWKSSTVPKYPCKLSIGGLQYEVIVVLIASAQH